VEDTLVLHWNGTKWTRQTSPNPPVSATSSLFGVACITATNCEAVGAYTWTSARRGFIEHWNGTNWAIVTTPNPTGANSGLGGVACASAALCNAVGYYTVGTVTKSLVLQRNGIKWSIVASPNPKGATQTILNAVACASTPTCNGQHGNPTVTDAVGQSGPALAPTSTSLIERYG